MYAHQRKLTQQKSQTYEPDNEIIIEKVSFEGPVISHFTPEKPRNDIINEFLIDDSNLDIYLLIRLGEKRISKFNEFQYIDPPVFLNDAKLINLLKSNQKNDLPKEEMKSPLKSGSVKKPGSSSKKTEIPVIRSPKKEGYQTELQELTLGNIYLSGDVEFDQRNLNSNQNEKARNVSDSSQKKKVKPVSPAIKTGISLYQSPHAIRAATTIQRFYRKRLQERIRNMNKPRNFNSIFIKDFIFTFKILIHLEKEIELNKIWLTHPDQCKNISRKILLQQKYPRRVPERRTQKLEIY